MKTRKAVLDEHTCNHCRKRNGSSASAGDVPDGECENDCRCVVVDDEDTDAMKFKPIKYTKLNEILDSKRDFGLFEENCQVYGYSLDMIEALAMEIRDLKDEIKELKRAIK